MLKRPHHRAQHNNFRNSLLLQKRREQCGSEISFWGGGRKTKGGRKNKMLLKNLENWKSEKYWVRQEWNNRKSFQELKSTLKLFKMPFQDGGYILSPKLICFFVQCGCWEFRVQVVWILIHKWRKKALVLESSSREYWTRTQCNQFL